MSQPIVQLFDIDAFVDRELSQFLCCAYALGNPEAIAAARAHRKALARRGQGLAGAAPDTPPFAYLAHNGWPDERQIRAAIDEAVTHSSENSKLLLEFFGELAGALCGIGRATALPGLKRLQAAGRLGDAATPRPEPRPADDVAAEPFRDRRQPGHERRAHDADAEPLSRAIGALQRNTAALEAEIARRKEAEKRLDRLIAHQERMVEEERKRIARELHDELGALLVGIGAHLSATLARAARDGQEPPPELLAASRLADMAAQTVRRVVTELRPSVLDNLGIWSSLEWYAGQVRERTSLQCECSIAPELHEIEPASEFATALFRIVQEALTNVVRHARASRVSIRAMREQDHAIVEIEDDGCGIETERLLQRDGFGIAGMYERARQFGADVKIAGVTGQGTVVALRFKLPAGSADTPCNQEG